MPLPSGFSGACLRFLYFVSFCFFARAREGRLNSFVPQGFSAVSEKPNSDIFTVNSDIFTVSLTFLRCYPQAKYSFCINKYAFLMQQNPGFVEQNRVILTTLRLV